MNTPKQQEEQMAEQRLTGLDVPFQDNESILALHAKHFRYQTRDGACVGCGERWPCTVAGLAWALEEERKETARLRAALAAVGAQAGTAAAGESEGSADAG